MGKRGGGGPAHESVIRFNLLTGEDTYASQTAQNPLTSRRLKGLIPSIAGRLDREPSHPTISASALAEPIVWTYEFVYRNPSTGLTEYYIFGISDSTLYLLDATNVWQDQTGYIGVLAENHGQAVTLNNLMHFSDGTSAWIFNPAVAGYLGGGWSQDGISRPLFAPAISTWDAGTLSIVTNRYYWITWYDDTAGQQHESSSSNRSLGTGAISSKMVRVSIAWPGTVDLDAVAVYGVVGTGTKFSDSLIGQHVYVVLAGVVTDIGVVTTVTSETQLSLVDPQTHGDQTGLTYIIGSTDLATVVPTSKWRIYASESENSNVGLLLAELPAATLYYDDESPFYDSPATLFSTVERPLLNDPPSGTKVMATGAYRIWRRDEAHPNYFNYTAYEEVLAVGGAGDPRQCVPGNDGATTVSTIENSQAYPDESREISGMVRHGPALYIGTEANIIPLYGESLSDFALAQVVSFKVGLAGPFSFVSCKHGLLFLSTERKVQLYPSQAPPMTAEATSSLIELSKPKRSAFEQIKASSLWMSSLVYYSWGRRDWAVLAFQDIDDAYHTWVFDFETGGWFELDKGVMFLNVWEVDQGVKVLVGTGNDGHLYILDDLLGYFPATLGAIATISIDTPGTTYVEGEVVVPAGGTVDAAVQIDTVTGSGAVLTAHLVPGEGGDGYSVASAVATTGGSGTGFKINILTISPVYAEGTYRPALIDYNDQTHRRIFHTLDYEISDASLKVEPRFWRDPVDVDNPGTGKLLTMLKVTGANRYRGFPKGPGLHDRLLLELKVPASVVNGSLRGIMIRCDPSGEMTK